MEVDSGAQPGITTDQHQRTKELEREVRELKRANEILRRVCPTKCFGYNALAETITKQKSFTKTALGVASTT